MRSVRRDASVVVLLWLLLMCAGRSGFLQDPGTFWHVATGERMLATGAVLRTDPFGVATYGKPWIPMQWLAELGMAWLHRLGGLDALVLAAALLLALLYAALLRHLLRRGLAPLAGALVLALTLAMSVHHFIARPHLFTIAFTALVQATLLRWEEDPKAGARLLLCLPACILLWTNLHGGAAGGLAMLTLTLAGFVVLPRLGFSATRLERVHVLLLLLVVCVSGLATLANPFFTDLPRTWFALSSSSLLPRLMKEHAAPSFATPGELLFALFALAHVALLLGVPWRAWRVTWLLPLAWLLLGMRSVRHIPLFAVTAAIVLPELLRESRFARRLHKHWLLALEHVAQPYAGLWLTTLVLFALGLTLQARRVHVPVLGAGWASPASEAAPLDMLPALTRAANARPAGAGILNEMSQGGFLMLYEPRLRVFIDDRWEVHGDATFARYVQASNERPAELVSWARSLGIDLALAPDDSPLCAELKRRADWTLLFHGQTMSLFELRR